MRGGIDIRFWGADHNLDHLQVWTTWELWTLRHEKARVSDEKARKSTQNEAKNRCFCVWDVDAAGSNPVTPGTHNSGVKYARANLFSGAPMVIVPPTYDDIALLGKVKNLLAPMGFGSITVSTADEHDRMIAFTSQLAHVVSNAYVKSPTARAHKGFSAGSYKDMTRVAWLNV